MGNPQSLLPVMFPTPLDTSDATILQPYSPPIYPDSTYLQPTSTWIDPFATPLQPIAQPLQPTPDIYPLIPPNQPTSATWILPVIIIGGAVVYSSRTK